MKIKKIRQSFPESLALFLLYYYYINNMFIYYLLTKFKCIIIIINEIRLQEVFTKINDYYLINTIP